MPNNSYSYTDENIKVISKTPISKTPISKKTICLNMIVKNEAHIIRETFDNILKYIPLSYWVISDTGSTDGTQQIIKDYFKSRNINGELFHDEWRDFGYNRTLALQHANKKTDYLFIFDADDSIHGDFKLPDNHMFHNEMYNLKFGGDNVAYVRPLLINNQLEWRFDGVLHEFLTCVSKSVEGTIVNGNYYVESGRKGSRSKDPEKYKKDAEVLKMAYYTDIEKPDKGLSNRYAFYCAQSYKDCGMIKEAIEWYKMVADKLDTWVQERYYSCFVLGDLYMRNNDFENAIRYLTKSILFDRERVEGVALACEILLRKEMYLLCCSLGDHFLGHTSPPPNKLFLFEPFYFNHIEYSCSIAGFYCGKHELGYECCKKIITTRCIDNVDKYIKTCINLVFYKDQLRNDKDDTLVLFYEYNENIQKLLNDNIDIDPRIHECWNILYEKNHTKLFELPKNIKSMFHNKTASIHKNKNEKINVFISFTTCKRFDLFKQTLGSILNHWLDVEKIDYWFCVDDNSSKKDRELMKSTFPWITYYMKSESEKGHRESMNIIWEKLSELRPKYWIHMEDDFLFYTRRNYVEDSITILKKYHDSKNVRQVLFNRNYAETIEHTNTKGHIVLEAKTSEECIPVLLHKHNTSEQFYFPNCCYWPDYSFRPSMIDVDTILGLGNYNTENHFFEMDYAYKWYNAGHRSAFFNMICCRHIGRLTSDRHDKTKPNSYELNNTLQFNLDKSHASIASHDFNTCVEPIEVDTTTTTTSIVTSESIRRSYSPPIKVASSSIIKILNLKHRDDRKISMIKQLNSCGFSDTEYEFIEAVYGKDLSSAPTMELYKMFEGNDFGSRCGFIGCALSHYGLWVELLRDETNDYYIIFEDDVILCDAYKRQISNMEKYFREKDVVYHGYTMYKDIRANSKDIYEYSSVNSTTNVSISPLKKEYYVGGTFGYTINKNGARKMIDYIHKHGIRHGIDYVMKIMNTLECYETQPNLCISLWHEDAKEYDTDIQNYYDVINFGIYENYYLQILKDMFFFIPCKDQIGHDIYHKPGSLKNMVLRAIDDKHCVAFNTLGFFKNNIVNTTTSSWFRDEDGIYIKKEYLYRKREMMKRDDCNHELQHLIDSIILEGIKTCEAIQTREIKNNSDNSDNSDNLYNSKDVKLENTVVEDVKLNGKDKKRVKMLCNWCFSNDLCIEFSNMFMDGEYEKWNDIELVSHNSKTEIDYYVIINMPHMISTTPSIYETTEYYDPKKTIIFQMEPWVYDTTKNWGVKTWGEWAIPDVNKFMKVFRHTECLNNVQWQVSPPEYIPEEDKKNKVISIVSNKLHDEGHKKRVDFLKRLDSSDLYKLYNGDNIHDVYGRENYHDLQSYVGKTDNKRELVKYKYCFSCENNWEKNYATEKIWEPILFECLCFYWGCPNLEDHIDSRAFVRLPLDNFDESVSIIRRAIEEDWWSQRIDIIKKEKHKIMNELGFFPRLHKIIHES